MSWDCLKEEDGGAEGNRTPDLRIANATLSQLSYGPDTAAGPPAEREPDHAAAPARLSSGCPRLDAAGALGYSALQDRHSGASQPMPWDLGLPLLVALATLILSIGIFWSAKTLLFDARRREGTDDGPGEMDGGARDSH